MYISTVPFYCRIICKQYKSRTINNSTCKNNNVLVL